MLFDTHVNLHAEQFAGDVDGILARARAAGVTRFVTICDRLDRYPAVRAIAEANEDITCTVGVHPHYAKDYLVAGSSNARRGSPPSESCRHRRDRPRPALRIQRHRPAGAKLRRTHPRGARNRLPLVVHTREADDLTGDILEREYARGTFPHPDALLHERRAPGPARDGSGRYLLGLRHPVVQGRVTDVRDVMARIPLDRIILETDCPYLAPVPHRGRRNEPAYLVDVCRAFADHRGLTFEEAARLTTANAIALFRRPA